MQPKQRPMLFNAQMVRAILAGTKTQTRRVVKPQPSYQGFDHAPRYKGALEEWGYPSQRGFKCPYGQPDDQLWVRETWRPVEYDVQPYRYLATNPSYAGKWRPSIHMPRAASRITLEIVGVRVERLQDISEDDATADGARLGYGEPFDPANTISDRRRYELLWEQINGHGSWDANPWVWVVEFKRVSP